MGYSSISSSYWFAGFIFIEKEITTTILALEMSIKKDYWICTIASLALISILLIIVYVFHANITAYLFTIGVIILVILPWYVLHRIRSNENEDAARLEVERVLKEATKDLTELRKDLRRSIRCFKRIDSYEKLVEEKRKKVKVGNKKELTVMNNLELIHYQIESIAEDLQDLLMLMKNYGSFYSNMLIRVAARRLQLKGKPIVRSTIEEEIKQIKG